MPDVPIGVGGVDRAALLREALAAEAVDAEKIPGLVGLDDIDVAEALCSGYYGARAWACFQIGKLDRDTARPILVDRAQNDPSDLVRAAVTSGLAGHTAKEVQKLVGKLLTDGSVDVRRAAVAVTRSVMGDAQGKKALAVIPERDRDWPVKALAKEKLKE